MPRETTRRVVGLRTSPCPARDQGGGATGSPRRLGAAVGAPRDPQPPRIPSVPAETYPRRLSPVARTEATPGSAEQDERPQPGAGPMREGAWGGPVAVDPGETRLGEILCARRRTVTSRFRLSSAGKDWTFTLTGPGVRGWDSSPRLHECVCVQTLHRLDGDLEYLSAHGPRPDSEDRDPQTYLKFEKS